MHKVTDVKARHARPIISKAYQSSSNQIITITTMCHFTMQQHCLIFHKAFPIHLNSFQLKLVLTLLAENWRTNLDNTEQESTNYKGKDLFTAYSLQYILSTTMTMAKLFCNTAFSLVDWNMYLKMRQRTCMYLKYLTWGTGEVLKWDLRLQYFQACLMW